MSAVRTNERPGTRAVHRFARVSAFKARPVLDLVRGKPLDEAYEILEFQDRAVAGIVLKVLDSAVANAVNNDELDEDELFVASCFADEGPTLKRWRPRARGRATRIRKRTCHITVIVARMDEDRLERRRVRAEARAERGTRSAAEQRRRRVERSRRAQATEAEEPEAEEVGAVEELEEEPAVGETAAEETTAEEDTTVAEDVTEPEAVEEAEADTEDVTEPEAQSAGDEGEGDTDTDTDTEAGQEAEEEDD